MLLLELVLMLMLCAVVLGWMHFLRQDDDLSLQSGFFKANILLSLTVLAGVATQVLLVK